MRKILSLFIVLIMMVSCLGKSTYSQAYTLASTFEYDYSYGYDYGKLFGADSLYYDTDTKLGFGWDCLKYTSNIDKDTDKFESGFILSYLNTPFSGKTEGLSNNKYRSCEKVPNKGRNTFVVFAQSSDDTKNTDADIEFMSSSVGMCVMSYCMVNNTVEVYDAVKSLFGNGDELKLKATGWKDEKETGSATIFLAKDTVMCNWTKFDLTKLGAIDKIDFEIISTNDEIPEMVCVDDVVASISIVY